MKEAESEGEVKGKKEEEDAKERIRSDCRQRGSGDDLPRSVRRKLEVEQKVESALGRYMSVCKSPDDLLPRSSTPSR